MQIRYDEGKWKFQDIGLTDLNLRALVVQHFFSSSAYNFSSCLQFHVMHRMYSTLTIFGSKNVLRMLFFGSRKIVWLSYDLSRKFVLKEFLGL